MKSIYAENIANWAGSYLRTLNCNVEIPNITGVCSLDNIKPHSLLFIKAGQAVILNDTEKEYLKTCLVITETPGELPGNAPFIMTGNARLMYARIVEHFFAKTKKAYICPTAIIHKNTAIPDTVYVGAYTIIEENVEIGEYSIIDDHVIIRENTTIGALSHIKSGAKIGEEAFGFDFNEDNTPIRIPHMGGVIIGGNVEIGVNCVISKGTIDNTVIKDHVKINDMSKIAHNVFIGEKTLITGARINGSVSIGSNCWIAPGVVVQNKVKIGNNTMVGTGSVVIKDIPGGAIAYGNPAKVIRKHNKFIFHKNWMQEIISK